MTEKGKSPFQLQVSIGNDLSNLQPIPVNTLDSIPITFPLFYGSIRVLIKNFHGYTPPEYSASPSTHPYFEESRKRSFSIQIKGYFNQEWNGNDLEWGMKMQRPVKVPMGWSLVKGFFKSLDPVTDIQPYGDKVTKKEKKKEINFSI